MIEEFYNPTFKDEQSICDETACCRDLPLDPSNVRRMIFMYLSVHYANVVNYGPSFEHLKCFQLETEDNPDGNFKIGMSDTDNNDDSDTLAYPGIYVGSPNFNMHKISMGDFAGNSEDNAREDIIFMTAQTIQIRHYFKESTQTTDMASLTAYYFTAVKKIIMQQTGITDLELQGAGPPKKARKNPKGYHRVDFTMVAHYEWHARYYEHSHRLKNLLLDVTI